jgi:ParB-like chromosome segregation protein Spo0J
MSVRAEQTATHGGRAECRNVTRDRVCRIVPDLQALAFPVGELTPLPGNPRQGDVQAVARSYSTFGQRKPIVARREGDGGIVIAGNHQLAAAQQLGWTHVAVVWVDDDDITAKAFALADNRTADLGTYDDADLLAMLQAVHDADAELFASTAYDEDALVELFGSTRSQLELAVVEYVAWFNDQRLHEALDDRTPREREREREKEYAEQLAAATQRR